MKEKNPYGLSEPDYKALYNAWWNMNNRCCNPKSERYYAYGSRGIKVCDEWKAAKPFLDWAMSNGWKRGLTIERVDLNEDYSPGNCTLIPMCAQAKSKTTNIRISINGQERCLSEWCQIFDFPFKRAWKRYRVFGYRDPETIFYPGDLRRRSTS